MNLIKTGQASKKRTGINDIFKTQHQYATEDHLHFYKSILRLTTLVKSIQSSLPNMSIFSPTSQAHILKPITPKAPAVVLFELTLEPRNSSFSCTPHLTSSSVPLSLLPSKEKRLLFICPASLFYNLGQNSYHLLQGDIYFISLTHLGPAIPLWTCSQTLGLLHW